MAPRRLPLADGLRSMNHATGLELIIRHTAIVNNLIVRYHVHQAWMTRCVWRESVEILFFGILDFWNTFSAFYHHETFFLVCCQFSRQFSVYKHYSFILRLFQQKTKFMNHTKSCRFSFDKEKCVRRKQRVKNTSSFCRKNTSNFSHF